jgi:hypothetical protein
MPTRIEDDCHARGIKGPGCIGPCSRGRRSTRYSQVRSVGHRLTASSRPPRLHLQVDSRASSFRPETQPSRLARVPFSIIFQLPGILSQLSAASSAC